MPGIRKTLQLVRCFGPRWLAFRAYYAAAGRLGLLRRLMPCRGWGEMPLVSFLADPVLAEPGAYAEQRRTASPRFFFSFSDRDRFHDSLSTFPAPRDADVLEAGHFRYFHHDLIELGLPPDWHGDPFTGDSLPADRHWSQIGDFAAGDIKAIWEPSRFGFTYALVRAYWRTGDEAYPLLFWRLFESWREANPPQSGPNWKCGQEIAFRVMAWCFALYGFLESEATTDERMAALAQAVAISAARIEGNIGYALSQSNNHGVSEAMGLFTVGLLFPEFKRSARWLREGRRLLERLARELIYDDGAFSQHSANYQRLMLHDYLWALRLADLNEAPLSDDLRARVHRSAEMLHQLQNEATGYVPCFGQSDGALILPLSECDYRDYRPVIAAAHYHAQGTRPYASGPWDEDLLWLFGPEALRAPLFPSPPGRGGRGAPATAFSAPDGGCHLLRSSSGFAFMRCATFRHRPAHADQLHVDIGWRGAEIACDAGTYGYNAPPPWDGNPLAATRYHNTVMVDDLDQMDRSGRFLWLPWCHGECAAPLTSPDGRLTYLEACHDGYTRLSPPVYHRRGLLRLDDDHWLILDHLESAAPHRYRLHWLLPDPPSTGGAEHRPAISGPVPGCITLLLPDGSYEIHLGVVDAEGDLSVVRADEASPRGWRSLYYAFREPALSAALSLEASSVIFYSLFGPGPTAITASGDTLELTLPDSAETFRLNPQGPLLDFPLPS